MVEIIVAFVKHKQNKLLTRQTNFLAELRTRMLIAYFTKHALKVTF